MIRYTVDDDVLLHIGDKTGVPRVSLKFSLRITFPVAARNYRDRGGKLQTPVVCYLPVDSLKTGLGGPASLQRLSMWTMHPFSSYRVLNTRLQGAVVYTEEKNRRPFEADRRRAFRSLRRLDQAGIRVAENFSSYSVAE